MVFPPYPNSDFCNILGKYVRIEKRERKIDRARVRERKRGEASEYRWDLFL